MYQLVEEATREASGHVDVTSVHGRLDVRVVVDINMPDLTELVDAGVSAALRSHAETRPLSIGTATIERMDAGRPDRRRRSRTCSVKVNGEGRAHSPLGGHPDLVQSARCVILPRSALDS